MILKTKFESLNENALSACKVAPPAINRRLVK